MSRPKHTFQNVLNSLIRRGRSREDAEDLVQEACTRMIEYSRTGKKVDNEEAFVRRTAEHLLIDDYRRNTRHPIVDASLEQLERTLAFLQASPTPDEVLAVEQRLIKLRDGLKAYSSRTYEIFVAHRAGHTYEEIATVHRISKSAVEKHIRRAVEWLMDHKESQ
jgi:RNA polymerase sigma factor (sigma-70 family)